MKKIKQSPSSRNYIKTSYFQAVKNNPGSVYFMAAYWISPLPTNQDKEEFKNGTRMYAATKLWYFTSLFTKWLITGYKRVMWI